VSGRSIDLVAPPFCGHLHPLLGIGRRLAREHRVRVISTEGAREQIAAAGLPAQSLLSGGDAAIFGIVEPPHAVRSNPLRLAAQLRANLALLGRLREELTALWERGRPDLLIADFTVPVAGFAASALGIPWWTTLPSPCAMETPDGPPGYLGGWRPRGDRIGRWRDAAGRRLIRGFKRGVHLLFRERMRQLGVPSLYRPDGTEAVYSAQRVLALGTAELEFPRRWPAAVELIGPVLYTPPSAAPPPPFLPGRRHVLVTLGTHLRWYKDRAAEAVRRAARALSGIEFHFSDGILGSTRHEADGNFRRLGYVPYARDLTGYDLVVHHGGAGVMYHCLRAGKPALVIPLDYDQFDHAARLEVAGVAWRVPRLDALPGLVARALEDPGLAKACLRHQALCAGYAPEDRVAALVETELRPARAG
jgi:UDP:flavonoid glycosyltransferase YjiC (YdhE family)